MDITFQETKDLLRAAKITFENMQPYYKDHAPDWDINKVLEVTQPLENIDIVLDSDIVGVLRLEFTTSYCSLRDLQVLPNDQNKGIGTAALKEAVRRTKTAQLSQLILRVLKVSPAFSLYERFGFKFQSEDERFFHMTLNVSDSIASF